ncbi:dentin sialophosphoprotein-like [Littorina saxatilis]|uniref:GRIP domain-containing protein n=1 Tax=Littorina saxatilis TaxID=31220 RepID=A0AAN9AR95_9CAEN
MAETTKNSAEHKDPTTSSDLGSSCENDVNLSVASDVKGKLRSDDGISFDGSVSLTLDSLEEEGDITDQEEQCSADLTQEELMNNNASNCSESDDSFYLHAKRESTKTETYRDKIKVSDLAVHSGQKNSTKGQGGKHKSTSPQSSTKDNGSEAESAISENEQRSDCVISETEHPPLSVQTKDTKSAYSETGDACPSAVGGKSVPHGENSIVLENRDSKSPSTIDEESNTGVVSAADDKTPSSSSLSLRKSRSLTEESSTDPSPKHSRPSAIPRRRSSDQSATSTPLSSSMRTPPRGTPRHSPAGLRRSLTLNSADLVRTPAGLNSADSSPGGTSPASFPCSPVKLRGRGILRRSTSQCENISVCSDSGCFTGIPANRSKETLTSRLRFEKHHHDHDQSHLDVSDTYLTPSQRKDLVLRDLKQRVKDLTKELEDRQREVEQLRARIEDKREQANGKLQGELEEARALAETARKEVTSLKESHEESVKTVATLQQQLEDVKRDKAERLAQAEEIFLEMYKKGRESAIFEREEEIELQNKGRRSSDATETDLRNKLVRTQAELAKWQTIQRHESYHTSPMPGTEAETTLRFLKDSVFHFLTADKKTEDEHLRAIVRILRFSEVQREKIAKAIIHKRNKSGW